MFTNQIQLRYIELANKYMIEFTAWPEMIAWPYLMLQGWLPYRDIAIAHTPLLIVVLSLFYKVFGTGIVQLKFFTWILIFLNAFLVYWVAKKLYTKREALWSVIIYIPLLLYYEGNGLWFDLALVPFALILFYLVSTKSYFKSGIVYALGLLTKQTFVYFIVSVAGSLINRKGINSKELSVHTLKRIKNFIFGAAIGIILFCIFLLAIGVLDDLYFWAFKFGIFYLPQADGQISLPTLKQFAVNIFPLSALLFSPNLALWAIPGVVGVYPRWELFHFQPALPFVAYAIVKAVKLHMGGGGVYKYFLAIYLLALILMVGRGIAKDLDNNTRFYESEVVNVVDELKAHNVKTLYVANYWDNIYGLSGAVPVTRPLIPYIPWYLDVVGVKENISSDLKGDLPQGIVVKERQNIQFGDLSQILDKYYECKFIENQIEVCLKNK